MRYCPRRHRSGEPWASVGSSPFTPNGLCRWDEVSSPPEAPRGREFALIWVLAAVLALPLYLVTARSVRALDVPASEAFAEFNEPRIDAFAAAVDQGAFGIVLLGDSRFRNAVPVDDELADRLTAAAGTDVAVLRIVNDWATYDDFAPLVPSLLAAEPDLVVMQEELRERARGSQAEELLQREYLWWKLIGQNSWSAGEPDQAALQSTPTCAQDDGVEGRLLRFQRWLRLDSDGPTAQRFADFDDQLREREIARRFVAIPVTSAAQQGLPSVTPAEPADRITPDKPIDDEHFCDVVHLNATGHLLFTEWFVDEIAAQIPRSSELPRPCSKQSFEASVPTCRPGICTCPRRAER